MTIIAERRYRKGKPIGPALEGAMPAEGEFDWIGLHEPGAEEIARVHGSHLQLQPGAGGRGLKVTLVFPG